MGRLTRHTHLNGDPAIEYKGKNYPYWHEQYNALSILARYEDLEEQGRLIELPCLPDEIVFATHEDCATVKVSYASVEHILYDLEAGWCIGYTKEEAEAKLEELKGGVK